MKKYLIADCDGVREVDENGYDRCAPYTFCQFISRLDNLDWDEEIACKVEASDYMWMNEKFGVLFNKKLLVNILGLEE